MLKQPPKSDLLKRRSLQAKILLDKIDNTTEKQKRLFKNPQIYKTYFGVRPFAINYSFKIFRAHYQN